jgi:diphthine-ammonia ligase
VLEVNPQTNPLIFSFQIDNITYVSGQIALVPGKMTIIEGGIRPECKLALRHVSRLTKAMNCKGQLRDVVQGICFLTHPSYITEARRIWEAKTTNAIMDFICVPALPRNALVEWQVWAHDHNDKFDCKFWDWVDVGSCPWGFENSKIKTIEN